VVRLIALLFPIALNAAPDTRTPTDIITQAPAADWRPIDAKRTVVMTLDAGEVVIELAPRFAPEHVANVQTLATERYFVGLTVNRVQDNFVAQWGDPTQQRSLGSAKKTLPSEFSIPFDAAVFQTLPDRDGFAKRVGFVDGFAAASDGTQMWLAHCYGTVGVGRDTAPDSSNGTELYAVIGHGPRQLDLNITTIGRAVVGIEFLSALKRGPGASGVFDKPEQGARIRAFKRGDASLKLEALKTDSASFQALIEARRNRRDAWYARPAGFVDLCNVPLPVRARSG
jgi:peptidylprolyl isomerase